MIIELETPVTIAAPLAISQLGKLSSTLPVSKQKTVRPTVAFLQSVAKWLGSQGLPGCTISAAWQFWVGMSDYSEACRKANETAAEIAYWFNVDPFTLTEEQQVGMRENLHRMQSQETIQKGDYSATDYNGIYNLFLAAYGDEDLARKMQTKAAELYVEQCTKQGKR